MHAQLGQLQQLQQQLQVPAAPPLDLDQLARAAADDEWLPAQRRPDDSAAPASPLEAQVLALQRQVQELTLLQRGDLASSRSPHGTALLASAAAAADGGRPGHYPDLVPPAEQMAARMEAQRRARLGEQPALMRQLRDRRASKAPPPSQQQQQQQQQGHYAYVQQEQLGSSTLGVSALQWSRCRSAAARATALAAS